MKEIIAIILIIQMMTSPFVMYKIRKYITENIVATIKRHPIGYSAHGRKNFPKETYAVLKDGSEINYGLPTMILTLQIFAGFIGIIILFTT